MDNEKIVEAVSDQMDTAMVEIAEALKGAVDRYGADAVDLALMAFRIEAAHHLLLGVMQLVVVFIVWKLGRLIWAATQEGWDANEDGPAMARAVIVIVGGIVGGLIFVAGALRLLSISAWVAVFGYPELRIAIKALEAAGLM